MDPKTQATTAVALLTPLVDGTRSDQLDLPTPCSEWKVRDLLNHVIGGGHMFTAGLRGQGMGDGAPPDFVSQAGHTRAYHDAIDGFTSALADVDSLDAPVSLPFGTLPAVAALQLAAGDLLVHAWDLATATGQPFDPPADFVDAAYGFFQGAVDDNLRAAGMFGPAVPVSDDAAPMARLLAHAGRAA